MLNVLNETRDLNYTIEELNANNWVKLDLNYSYQLLQTKSSYEQLIKKIYAYRNFAKIKTVDDLITNVWAPEEKAVFISIRPVNALLCYWVS